MGLFKELILLPLAPVRGTAWVAEQIGEEADRQLYDEDNIKRELLQLEMDHASGAVGDEERERIERDPGPGHHRAVAAAEVLRVREHDRGSRTPAQKPLGRRERTEHRPGEAAQVVHHRT